MYQQVDQHGKLTWKQIREFVESSGVKDNDEIDCIELSWTTADQLKLIKDEDFGWKIIQRK